MSERATQPSVRAVDLFAGSEPPPRLTYDELRQRLDDIFYLDVAGGRSYDELLDLLVLLPRPKQDFALHWGKVAARTHLDLGQLVIELAPKALRAMNAEQAGAWVVAALDDYDGQGMRAAVARLRDIEGFLRRQSAVRLEHVAARLALFVRGLSARPLEIAEGEAAWTDTATLHLPPQLACTDAVGRYKALAALLWAQSRYGTFGAITESALAAQADPQRAAAWLALLEAIRLEARLKADYPGLAAPLADLLAELPAALNAVRPRLVRPEATVADSIAALPALLEDAPPPSPFGALQPALAGSVRAERVRQDTQVLRKAIAGLKGALGKAGQGEGDVALAVAADGAVEMRIDGEIVTLPPEGTAAAQSLFIDLGEIPPSCLVPAGPGEWRPTPAGSGELPAPATVVTADALYDEWDYRRRAYRRQWCHLYLRELPPGEPGYVAEVRQRHAALIRQVRRRFEALRGEDRMLRRQPDGPEIDLDALVETLADRRGGAEPSERVFSRRSRNERSLAAMFMVDMSGSTKGWVNDAEREALVMLCEALETLGDRYAIWGFSGWTRTRSELYRIKDFAAPYDKGVEDRIAAIEAKDYTRMGPPIRHLTQLLLAEPARHRLLITLSDGRPDDFGDEYRGEYGIEDTRQALLEARQAGVRAYCVTIDRHGADYLRRMYGPASYTVLDDVKKLPLKIADIYRRLAT